MQGWELCSYSYFIDRDGTPFSYMHPHNGEEKSKIVRDVLSCLISKAKLDQLDDLASFHCSSQ